MYIVWIFVRKHVMSIDGYMSALDVSIFLCRHTALSHTRYLDPSSKFNLFTLSKCLKGSFRSSFFK